MMDKQQQKVAKCNTLWFCFFVNIVSHAVVVTAPFPPADALNTSTVTYLTYELIRAAKCVYCSAVRSSFGASASGIEINGFCFPVCHCTWMTEAAPLQVIDVPDVTFGYNCTASLHVLIPGSGAHAAHSAFSCWRPTHCSLSRFPSG